MNLNVSSLISNVKSIRVLATIIILVSICFSAKAQKQTEIPSLKPVKVKYGFRDSVYVIDTKSIIKHGKYFYLDDINNHRVLKIDSSLNLVKIIGREGKGPGEFQKAGPVTTNNDSLYVYDDGAMRFNVFTTDGQYIRTFNVPYRVFSKQIAVMNNKLYLSSRSYIKDQSSIFITDLNGKLIKFFGPDPAHPKLEETKRFLFSTPDKKQIIAVSNVYPFINRYSANGKLLESFDLQKIHALDPLWDWYQKNKSKNTRRLSHITLWNAYMDGSILYIACTGWPGWDYNARIIKLLIKPNRIKPLAVFKIRGLEGQKYMNRFFSICVTGDTLIGYEGYMQAICEYDLSKLEQTN